MVVVFALGLVAALLLANDVGDDDRPPLLPLPPCLKLSSVTDNDLVRDSNESEDFNRLPPTRLDDDDNFLLGGRRCCTVVAVGRADSISSLFFIVKWEGGREGGDPNVNDVTVVACRRV